MTKQLSAAASVVALMVALTAFGCSDDTQPLTPDTLVGLDGSVDSAADSAADSAMDSTADAAADAAMDSAAVDSATDTAVDSGGIDATVITPPSFPLKAMPGNDPKCNQSLDCNPTAGNLVADITSIGQLTKPTMADKIFNGSPGHLGGGFALDANHWQGASRFYPAAAKGTLKNLMIMSRSGDFKNIKNQFEVYTWSTYALLAGLNLQYDQTHTKIASHFHNSPDPDYNHSSCPQVIGKYFVMGAESKGGGGNYLIGKTPGPHAKIKIFDASPLGNNPPQKPKVVGSEIAVYKQSMSDEKFAAAAIGVIKLNTGHFLIASLTTEKGEASQSESLGMLLYISSTTNLETAKWTYIDNVRFKTPKCSNCALLAYNSLHLASDKTGAIFGLLGYNSATIKGLGKNYLTAIKFTVNKTSASGTVVAGPVELKQGGPSEIDFGASMGIFIGPTTGKLEVYGTEYFDNACNCSLTVSNWKAK